MKIAVSACLLGKRCRYDGASAPDDAVRSLAERHELIAVCPEQLGGLPTPRPASEIVGRDGNRRVITVDGVDVTDRFRKGAELTLAIMAERGCRLAILKSRSPSCGSGEIYDGTFNGALIPGWGVAAESLRDAGYPVLDEQSCLSFPGLADGSWHPSLR